MNLEKIIRLTIGIGFGLAVAATSSRAGNVLSNPGFEFDPLGETTVLPGWFAYGGNAYGETSSSSAHSGTNYFKVYQAFNGQVNYTGVYQDYISGPGATYAADGWARTIATDVLKGQNMVWIEVTFHDANAKVLALYRSSLITTNAILAGAFPPNTWIDLPVTNQYDPNSYAITNSTAVLAAPAGTYFVRYQIVFQGDANNSGGSVYFDDLNLNSTGAAPYGNWNIVWCDEFNGSNVNPNIWTYDLGNGGTNSGWGNNELEYYTSRTNNAYVAGGLLHIVARQDSTYTNGYNYTSARLKTQGLQSWLYGRFEWRARLPVGSGFWPALWFLGANIDSLCWPQCGEIDVMENDSGSPAVGGTIHANTSCGVDNYETASYNFLNGDSVTNFHTYTLDWSTNSILWYVDGHLYETQTTNWVATGSGYPAPFNQPFFIIMNLAVGGNYVGNPGVATINASGGFPGDMQVDYVRVYQPTAPLKISLTRTNGNWLVSWPSNIVAHVQAQLNPLNGSLGTNWSDLLPTFNPATIYPTNASSFYRLLSP